MTTTTAPATALLEELAHLLLALYGPEADRANPTVQRYRTPTSISTQNALTTLARTILNDPEAR